MPVWVSVIVVLGVVGILLYHRISALLWTVVVGISLAALTHFTRTYGLMIGEWFVFAIISLMLNVSFLRRNFLAAPIFYIYKKIMPSMSDTEKQALEAGDVWWEGDLFSGAPNWKKLYRYPAARLTAEELAFIAGPVQQLCDKVDNYQITLVDKKIPVEIWDFIKSNGFLAMIIPKKYGGLGFSQAAHGRIVEKLYSCSITVGTSVGVPNSLGPGELLMHYGTEEQKNYYLPRLAKGQEIPCFALTGPDAGSDASSMPDTGVVCRGTFEGKEVLGVRLNFDKRYITLAPIATVIGLAFKLEDPDHLLGHVKDRGITCALLSRDIPGIEIGRRHWPANNPFQNGPIKGHDVFIPVDSIIGGPKMAGQGWRMLMECLSVGRAISLPSTGVASSKVAAMTTGAYARIRKQFGVPIGKFEAVGEVLGRIGANAYWIEASFNLTLAALNDGVKPAVPSGILKYHLTEAARSCLIDAMDVHGGKAVMMGPGNYLSSAYQGMPIAITVEGANILTRSLIIFGQGAIRCHPYVLKEMTAAQMKNVANGLKLFNKAFFAHLGFFASNMVRSVWMAITSARFVRVPAKPGLVRYQQHLTRFSSAFALATDMAMFTMGGDLKRKEQLSARFGDVLSKMYIASAVMRRFIEDGSPKEDLPLLRWSCDDALYTIQTQLDGILRNFPNRLAAGWLRVLIFPLGKHFKMPNDRTTQKIAEELMLPDSQMRARVIAGMYLPSEGKTHPYGQLLKAFDACYATEQLEKVLMKAVKENEVTGFSYKQRIDDAANKGIITRDDAKKLLAMNELREPVIAVDDFAPDGIGK